MKNYNIPPNEIRDESDFVYSLDIEQRKFFYKLMSQCRSQSTITKTYRKLGENEVISREDFCSTNDGKTLKAVIKPSPLVYVKDVGRGYTFWREL